MQPALDWLDANGDNEAMFKEPEVDANEANQPTQAPSKTCLKCNQCGKKFSAIEQAEMHASRTGHDDFQESHLEAGESFEVSSEPVKVLTEEEKAAKLEELRAKVAAKRAAREKELAEMELKRKTEAKELEQVRRELELKEMKKIAEERRQEKIMDRKLREDIKRQIEEDRLNKKAAEEAEKALRRAEASGAQESVVIAPNAHIVSSGNADHARIQIRLPPPQPALKFTFDSPKTTTLAELKQKIAEAIGKSSCGDLFQTVPPRTFTSADDGKTLFELELCPSASLLLK